MVLAATLQTSTAPARDALSMAADVSVVIVGLAVSFALVFAVFQLHRIGTHLRELRRHAETRAGPLLDRSKAIATNLEYISATLRTDVEHVHGSVRALSDRLQQASDRMEERIEEFNALMEVVQGEAESAFIGTASTVRGLQAGAQHLRDGGPPHEALEPGERAREALEVKTPDGPGTRGDHPSSERTT